MTMLLLPVFLLAFLLPVLAVYAGVGGALWLFGGRWQRRGFRVAGKSLAWCSVFAAVVLVVGNVLWLYLDGSGGPLSDGAFLRWLTYALFLGSGAAFVGPPVLSVLFALLRARSTAA